MRVVAWNCRDASRVKFEALKALEFDIAIVPEISRVQLEALEYPKNLAAHAGPKLGKGIAIFVGSGWSIEVVPQTQSLEWFLPAVCKRAALEIRVLAVWALPSSGSYAKPLKFALDYHRDWLRGGPSVVAGDFNANVSFGADGKTFAKVVDQLAELGLVSAWHQHHDEQHGNESGYSYFHRFKSDHRFHIDFVFAPDLPAWRPRSVKLGEHSRWVEAVRSDHVPLIVDFGKTGT